MRVALTANADSHRSSYMNKLVSWPPISMLWVYIASSPQTHRCHSFFRGWREGFCGIIAQIRTWPLLSADPHDFYYCNLDQCRWIVDNINRVTGNTSKVDFSDFLDSLELLTHSGATMNFSQTIVLRSRLRLKAA
jgi:hypothetical protein